MENTKIKCKRCGGRIVIEYLEQYGDVYLMKSNGEPYSKRIKRVKYTGSDYEPLVYCLDCKIDYAGGFISSLSGAKKE